MTASKSAVAEGERHAACTSFSNAAATIMHNRQSEVAMSKMLEVAANDQSEAVAGVMRALIVAAYEKPRLLSEEYQARSIQDFENEVFLECIKSFGTTSIR